MATVEKSVLVTFSAQQMFDLVRNVNDYPQFLPWCSTGQAEQLEPLLEKATVGIAFSGIKQSFCTMNRLETNKAIRMALLNGPFKALQGEWVFTELASNACKINFRLEYEFSSKILEQLVGPVFHKIANSFVDGFIQRAETLYGTKRA
jgi:ribosome-associated toxin RatA of RatAB toxin-antitoxin module